MLHRAKSPATIPQSFRGNITRNNDVKLTSDKNCLPRPVLCRALVSAGPESVISCLSFKFSDTCKFFNRRLKFCITKCMSNSTSEFSRASFQKKDKSLSHSAICSGVVLSLSSFMDHLMSVVYWLLKGANK